MMPSVLGERCWKPYSICRTRFTPVMSDNVEMEESAHIELKILQFGYVSTASQKVTSFRKDRSCWFSTLV